MIKAALSMTAIFTINSIFWVIFHSHFNAAHSPCLFFKLSLCIFCGFISNKKVTSDYIRVLAPSKFTLMLRLERFSKLCFPQLFSFSFLTHPLPPPPSFLRASGLPWPEVNLRFENLRVFQTYIKLYPFPSIMVFRTAYVNSHFLRLPNK